MGAFEGLCDMNFHETFAGVLKGIVWITLESAFFKYNGKVLKIKRLDSMKMFNLNNSLLKFA